MGPTKHFKAPQPADTDKLREALQSLYSAVDSCVDLTPEVMHKAKAALDSTALQAPVREVPEQGWISVNDQLPDEETDVVIYQYSEGFGHHFAVAGLFGDAWLSAETEDDSRFEPTHWHALPAAPVQQEPKP